MAKEWDYKLAKLASSLKTALTKYFYKNDTTQVKNDAYQVHPKNEDGNEVHPKNEDGNEVHPNNEDGNEVHPKKEDGNEVHPKKEDGNKSQWYRAIKDILGIKFNIETNKLLSNSLGRPWLCWLSDRCQKLFSKLKLGRNPQMCSHDGHTFDQIKQPTIIKTTAQKDGKCLLKWKLDCYFKGW